MNQTDNLIDWIHRVEYDPKKLEGTKRLHSLVTELYFENYLLLQVDLGLKNELTFGWSTAYDKNWKKCWFKLTQADASENIKATCGSFIYCISNRYPNDLFYVIQPLVEIKEIGAPTIEWKITKLFVEHKDGKKNLKICRDPMSTRSANDIASGLKRNVDAKLCGLQDLKVEPTIKQWLSNFDEHLLKRLLASRCFLNYLDWKGIKDIDAIGLNTSREVEIIEFKRKNPAIGVKFQFMDKENRPFNLDQYLTFIKEFRSGVKSAIDRKGIIEKCHNDGIDVNRIIDPCFGLDESHAKNVEVCEVSGLIYRYIIWDSSASTVGDLFDGALNPREPMQLYFSAVSAQSFIGLSSTIGLDSGTWDKKTRFQVMIPVTSFDPVPPRHNTCQATDLC